MSEQLHTASGRPINHRNLREIGRGGEARIYELDRQTVFKLYNQPVERRMRRGLRAYDKLELMTGHPPVTRDNQGNQVLAWPSELVYGEEIPGIRRRPIAGFLMPRVGGPSYRHIYNYWNPQARSELKDVGQTPRETSRLLEAIAYNLIEMMSGVHDQGYLVGDINEQNILVDPTGLIAILDADSFQVRDPNRDRIYTCSVGRPEYTSPGCLIRMKQLCPGLFCDHLPDGKRTATYACMPRRDIDDQFSLAVVLFKLLMNGRHPFDGSPGRNYQEKILGRQPAVVHHPGALPAQALQRWASLRADWQEYLIETFEAARYRPESEIPDASDIFRSPAGLGNQRTIQPPPSAPAPTRPNPQPATTANQANTPAARPAANSSAGPPRNTASQPQTTNPVRQPPPATVKQCQVCGHTNTVTEIYCQRPGCQQKLDFRMKDCPRCNRRIPHNAAYCRHCGGFAGRPI